MQEKIQKDRNFKTNICPNILQLDADSDAAGIAIALQTSALKCRRAKKRRKTINQTNGHH